MKEGFLNTPLILDIEQILEVLGYVLTLKHTAVEIPPRLSLIEKRCKTKSCTIVSAMRKPTTNVSEKNCGGHQNGCVLIKRIG